MLLQQFSMEMSQNPCFLSWKYLLNSAYLMTQSSYFENSSFILDLAGIMNVPEDGDFNTIFWDENT